MVGLIGWVANPESVDRLCTGRPETTEHPRIIGRYNVRPDRGLKSRSDRPWLWCSHCQKFNHWAGYVAESDVGVRYLVGGDCGANHYGGENFRAAIRSYHEAERRDNLSRRIGLIKADLEALRDYAQALVNSPGYRAIRDKADELKRASENLVIRLRASSISGSMSVLEPAKSETGRDTLVPVQLGRLEGSVLVNDQLSNSVKAYLEALDGFDGIEPLELSNGEMTRLIKSFDETWDRVSEASNDCSNASRFFSLSNLQRLKRWSIPLKNFLAIEWNNNELVIWDSQRGSTSVRPLQAIQLPVADLHRESLAA